MAALKMSTTTRNRTIIETSGDDVLPGNGHIESARVFQLSKRRLEPKLLESILGHSDSILCAKFSPGGSMFASGSKDATLRVWDVIRSKNPLKLTTEGGEAMLMHFPLPPLLPVGQPAPALCTA